MNSTPHSGANASSNPRLALLRQEVDQTVLKPFRSHGWNAKVEREIDHEDCIEIVAEKGGVNTRIAVLYSSSGIPNSQYKQLSTRVEHIFFHGQPYMLDTFAQGVTIPVEPLSSFFPLLVTLNKRVEPDLSPPALPRRTQTVRHLTAENPIEAVLSRLQQFTSVHLAAKLVERRASTESISLPADTIASKATGVAFLMRSALDYIATTSGDKLNKRVLGLYYGVMAFAQAEMLAAPSGPIDLDEVEGMTKQGHGLYTLPALNNEFAELHVGVLATGFLPQWLTFLGHDTSSYPTKKPRSTGDVERLPENMACSLKDLFASMPEIDDLFAEVFRGPPRWVNVAYDSESNATGRMFSVIKEKVDSTYALFIDQHGLIDIKMLNAAGWPLAEIQLATEHKGTGIAFRARVDHVGHEVFWNVLPTHSSPFGKHSTLLFPTVGGMREYRTVAAVTLYALSIMVRYMPSAWRRIEGGDQDQYLAVVMAALSVWERLLPEHFLESIAGEAIRTAQPGSWMA